MKRYGHLFERVCSFDGLIVAAREAAKGKKGKIGPAEFLCDLEREVLVLKRELIDDTYRPRPYHTFMIHDPKERMICAAEFRDRVAHHAACRVLEPILEEMFIEHSYACRKGKGTLAALQCARRNCGKYSYFLKLDIRKFFDSIDHEVLKTLLLRKIKDPSLLRLLDRFIDHPVPWTAPGKGIPIGNLTSQHFANFYMNGLDHYIKEQLGVRGYLRYMDDLVLFGHKKRNLWDAFEAVERYLNHTLQLTVKPGSVLLAPVTQGLPFLGFQIFAGTIRISRAGWRRFRRKVMDRERLAMSGRISEDELVRSVAALIGHLKHGDTRNLRAMFFERGQGQREARTV